MANLDVGGKGGDQGLVFALRSSPANRREMLLALEEFRQRVLAEPGCTACDVLEDVSETNRFLWMEWWSDPIGVDQIVSRARFRALIGAVQLLGRAECLQRLDRRETTDVAIAPSPSPPGSAV